MNSKKSLALVSTSALAAGMAHGSVIYSGPLNLQQNFAASGLARRGVDMTGDGTNDFAFGYEANAALKPYVDARTSVETALPNQSGMLRVLTKANTGFPVTSAGTLIDAAYAATYPPQPTSEARGYMYQNGGGDTVVGDWSNTATTDAYVGIELVFSGGTSFGWLHFIDNPTSSPQSLTLVNWAYQSTPGVGIAAGAIPEPSAFALSALGLAGLVASRRRR